MATDVGKSVAFFPCTTHARAESRRHDDHDVLHRIVDENLKKNNIYIFSSTCSPQQHL